MGGLVACSSGGGSEGAYCTEIGDHADELRSPAIATADDVERTLDLYRTIAAAAPLAVADEWGVLVGTLETASTVDPTDAASLQRASDAARSSQQAVDAVIEYTRAKCGVTLGQPVNTVPTVTLPPTTAG